MGCIGKVPVMTRRWLHGRHTAGDCRSLMIGGGGPWENPLARPALTAPRGPRLAQRQEQRRRARAEVQQWSPAGTQPSRQEGGGQQNWLLGEAQKPQAREQQVRPAGRQQELPARGEQHLLARGEQELPARGEQELPARGQQEPQARGRQARSAGEQQVLPKGEQQERPAGGQLELMAGGAAGAAGRRAAGGASGRAAGGASGRAAGGASGRAAGGASKRAARGAGDEGSRRCRREGSRRLATGRRAAGAARGGEQLELPREEQQKPPGVGQLPAREQQAVDVEMAELLPEVQQDQSGNQVRLQAGGQQELPGEERQELPTGGQLGRRRGRAAGAVGGGAAGAAGAGAAGGEQQPGGQPGVPGAPQGVQQAGGQPWVPGAPQGVLQAGGQPRVPGAPQGVQQAGGQPGVPGAPQSAAGRGAAGGARGSPGSAAGRRAAESARGTPGSAAGRRAAEGAQGTPGSAAGRRAAEVARGTPGSAAGRRAAGGARGTPWSAAGRRAAEGTRSTPGRAAGRGAAEGARGTPGSAAGRGAAGVPGAPQRVQQAGGQLRVPGAPQGAQQAGGQPRVPRAPQGVQQAGGQPRVPGAPQGVQQAGGQQGVPGAPQGVQQAGGQPRVPGAPRECSRQEGSRGCPGHPRECSRQGGSWGCPGHPRECSRQEGSRGCPGHPRERSRQEGSRGCPGHPRECSRQGGSRGCPGHPRECSRQGGSRGCSGHPRECSRQEGSRGCLGHPRECSRQEGSRGCPGTPGCAAGRRAAGGAQGTPASAAGRGATGGARGTPGGAAGRGAAGGARSTPGSAAGRRAAEGARGTPGSAAGRWGARGARSTPGSAAGRRAAGGARGIPGSAAGRRAAEGARGTPGSAAGRRAAEGARAPQGVQQVGGQPRMPGAPQGEQQAGGQPGVTGAPQGEQQLGGQPGVTRAPQGEQQAGEQPGVTGAPQGVQLGGGQPMVPGEPQGVQQAGGQPRVPRAPQGEQQAGGQPGVTGAPQGAQQPGGQPRVPWAPQGAQQAGGRSMDDQEQQLEEWCRLLELDTPMATTEESEADEEPPMPPSPCPRFPCDTCFHTFATRGAAANHLRVCRAAEAERRAQALGSIPSLVETDTQERSTPREGELGTRGLGLCHGNGKHFSVWRRLEGGQFAGSHSGPGIGQKALITERLGAFWEGRWRELFDFAMAAARPAVRPLSYTRSDHDPDAIRLSRCRSRRCERSTRLAAGDEVPQWVRNFTIDTAQRPSLTTDILARAIHTAARASAAGPSGWVTEHLRDTFLTEPTCLSHLLEVFNQWVAGQVPERARPWLAASNLVGLSKPNGDVRPVAIGEVLPRILARALCISLRPAMVSYFLQCNQLGAGTKVGAEILTHSFRSALATHPDWCALQIDVANAFNSFHRHRPVPPSGPFRTEPRVSTGIEARGPARPFLFAFTQQQVMEPVTREFKDLLFLSYADDTYILGPAARILEAFGVLRERLEWVGLEVQAHKCRFWEREGKEVERALPWGCSRWMRMASHLLAIAVSARPMYLAGLCPDRPRPEVVEAFRDWDSCLEDCFEQLFPPGTWEQDPDRSRRARMQLHLPVRLGGFGIRAAASLSPLSYVCGWAQAARDIAQLGVAGEEAMFAEYLTTSIGAEFLDPWFVKALEQLPATIRHEIPGLPLCVAAPPVRLFQARQRQLAVEELHPLRRLAHLTFTAAEWGIAAAIRLGLPTQQLQVAGRCVCGTAYVDPADPHHALRCRHQHGPSRVHDEVKFAVAKISKAGGGVVTLEDSVVLQGKRVDVAVRRPMAGEAHALEISVADPLSLSPSLLGQSGRQIGVAAREWERRKTSDYAPLLARNRGVQFTPLIVETWGCLGGRFQRWLRQQGDAHVGLAVCRGACREDDSVFSAYLLGSLKALIGVASQRAQARVILLRAASSMGGINVDLADRGEGRCRCGRRGSLGGGPVHGRYVDVIEGGGGGMGCLDGVS
ncbi:unnamed protein product [Closterium sp. NIES-65]|nr:unnamed protein product [Closterium sp. NIES-65]